MKIEKIELIVIFSLVVFALIWVFALMPFLSGSPEFASLNPIVQYIIFNLGYMAFTTIFPGLPISYYKHKKIHLFELLKVGFASFLLYSFVWDMWQPPFYLSPMGRILITEAAALPGTAVDAFATYLWGFLVSANWVITINTVGFAIGLIIIGTGFVWGLWSLKNGSRKKSSGLKIMAFGFIFGLFIYFMISLALPNFNVTMSMLYMFVYFVTPLIASIASSVILVPKQWITSLK